MSRKKMALECFLAASVESHKYIAKVGRHILVQLRSLMSMVSGVSVLVAGFSLLAAG
jgi:hypothetical protein